MDSAKPRTIFYKRSHFVTHLPEDFLYSPSHYWMARHEGNLWRVGLTRFATRMLGEMVDHGFELEENAAVSPGKIIGWIEGFKAMSDVYCIADGTFAGTNPVLKENIIRINKDPYGNGWIYAVRGTPDTRCVDVKAYAAILDVTIDKILEKEKAEQ